MPNLNRAFSSIRKTRVENTADADLKTPVCEMRGVLNSSDCCGARHPASVFSFGVTALYVRKERCQYKCQNVLAFLGITFRGRYALSNIAKLRAEA